MWKQRLQIFVFLDLLVLVTAVGIRMHVLEKTEQERTVIETSQTIVASDMKPKIALTFDDGPHPVFTPELLDGLKERNVQATFFVIGKNVTGNEEIIKRMADDGHLIGNHTFDHVEITKLSQEEASDEIVRTSDLVEEITGSPTEYVRPPFGLWKDDLECGIQMIPVMWTVDPLDWTTGNATNVVNKVVTKVKENDIILLHDYYESSVQAALRIVDILQKEGYEFVTVDELILE
ncbi:polysaccharide deacetylase family protein [Diplocloster hominis]|uniref:polysaccharide deacetylase family protein n=1 Tax=Diplocloster hominis TaxID=3079010 RepID=UPI0031B9F16C